MTLGRLDLTVFGVRLWRCVRYASGTLALKRGVALTGGLQRGQGGAQVSVAVVLVSAAL